MGLVRKNYALYCKILKESKVKKITVEEYMKRFGFTYKSKRRVPLEDHEVAESLEKLFPDKIIKNISDISKKSSNLYNNIIKISKGKDIEVSDYVEELGFEYTNKYSKGSKGTKTRYDVKLVKKLCDEYDINVSELSRIIEESKQNLDQ